MARALQECVQNRRADGIDVQVREVGCFEREEAGAARWEAQSAQVRQMNGGFKFCQWRGWHPQHMAFDDLQRFQRATAKAYDVDVGAARAARKLEG